MKTFLIILVLAVSIVSHAHRWTVQEVVAEEMWFIETTPLWEGFSMNQKLEIIRLVFQRLAYRQSLLGTHPSKQGREFYLGQKFFRWSKLREGALREAAQLYRRSLTDIVKARSELREELRKLDPQKRLAFIGSHDESIHSKILKNVNNRRMRTESLEALESIAQDIFLREKTINLLKKLARNREVPKTRVLEILNSQVFVVAGRCQSILDSLPRVFQ